MTHEELTSLVEYWKKRLGLHSWDITAEFCRRKDIHDEAVAAACIQEQLERAKISLSRIEDREDSEDPIELDLLHELVHVRLWSIFPRKTDFVEGKCAESAVEWLARALYNEKCGRMQS